MQEYFKSGDKGPTLRAKFNQMWDAFREAIANAAGPRGWSPVLAAELGTLDAPSCGLLTGQAARAPSRPSRAISACQALWPPPLRPSMCVARCANGANGANGADGAPGSQG